MRRKAGWVLAATVAAALVGCADVSQRGTTFVGNEVLGKVGLERYWELPLGLSPGQTLVRLTLVEENLYCLTNDNVMIAVDAAKGVRKWTRTIAPASQQVFPPCHSAAARMAKDLPGIEAILRRPPEETLPAQNVVIVNTTHKALVLSRDSGEVLREISFDLKSQDFVANTGGACDGTYFYVGSNDGRVVAYHLNTLTVAWVLYTPQILWAAPRVQQSSDIVRVYVAGADGHLYVLRAGDALAQVWPPESRQGWPTMSSEVVAPIVVDNRAAFVPSVQRRVFAFPLRGGEPLWKFSTQGDLLDPIQVSEQCVYQYARGDKLYALDPASGRARWSLSEGRRVLAAMPTAQGPSTFVLDHRGNLLLVDEVLGKVRAAVPLTRCSLYADNTAASGVWVGDRDGRLYCLRQVGAEHMTAASLKKVAVGKAPALPALPVPKKAPAPPLPVTP
jgi:outer membrane protein assembly factor BamB